MCVNVTDGSTPQASVEQELLALADRLSDFREQGSRASAQDLVAELETALEELRVTSEEIAAQQRHIAELLEDNVRARATADRLVAGIPTPVMTTDADGTTSRSRTGGRSGPCCPMSSTAARRHP
jgi:sensor domain CHASE-containing protein